MFIKRCALKLEAQQDLLTLTMDDNRLGYRCHSRVTKQTTSGVSSVSGYTFEHSRESLEV